MSHESWLTGGQDVTWTRLLPRPRDEKMMESVRAEIRDPLWMLSRQWQMHEFRGEDAGTPVQVDLDAEHETISQTDLAPGADRADAAPPRSYDGTVPLETLVEREDVLLDRQETEPGMRRAAEAGLYFLRLLRKEGFTADGIAYTAEDFPPALRLKEPADAVPQSDRRYATLMGGRALDGVVVFQLFDEALPDARAVLRDETIDWSRASVSALPLPEDRTDGFDISTHASFTKAAEEYIEWYCTLFSEPTAEGDTGPGEEEGSAGSAWIPERLEYEAAVTVGTGTTKTVFTVPEYEGGRLDWDSFSVADEIAPSVSPMPSPTDPAPDNSGPDNSDPEPGEPPEGTIPPDLSALPTQITFPGMPVPRWWELEETSSVLSDISPRGAPLPRLLPIRIAREFGNDWYALPLDVPVGSFTRVTHLEITDSFGVSRAARPAVEDDDGFELFMSHSPAHPEPGLFVPPTLGDAVTGDPVEDVLFARDEQANLAFGIERTFENSVGGITNRNEFREPVLHIDDVVVADGTESGEVGELGAATPRHESVTLSNPGDDILETTGWRVVVSPSTGGEAPVTFRDYEIDTDLEAGHSLTLVASPEPPDAPEEIDTADASDVGETRRVDFGAPLSRAAAVSVYASSIDGPSGGDPTASRLVARHVLEGPPDALADYRIATDIPDHWFPFEPTDADGDRIAERLERAVLLDASTFGIDPEFLPTPQGEILNPDPELLQSTEVGGSRPYRLYDEEVPPSGQRVTRNYQFARWIDGSTHLWVGRRVSAGQGEVSSGLKFDILEDQHTSNSDVTVNEETSPPDSG